jgi:transposase
MLSFNPSTRIFLAVEPCDMRRSFDGLSAIARDVIGEDPLSGYVFAFTNKRRNRLKLLFWDGSGLWVCAKRLERGTFAWPTHSGDTSHRLALRHEELTALLVGLDLDGARRRPWYRREKFTNSPTKNADHLQSHESAC